MKKYCVIITFDNNDYIQTYFNACNTNEIINHCENYKLEYYNGETTKVYALEIRDPNNKAEEIYYY